jgi:cardiolipin synthase
MKTLSTAFAVAGLFGIVGAIGCSAASSDSDSAESASKKAVDCTAYVAPATQSTCKSTCTDSSCQQNGCYGGYWCDTTTEKCVAAPPSTCTTPADTGPVIISSFETPSSGGLDPVIAAIRGAHSSIHMAMYHLTVQAVVDELVDAVQKNHVDVELIVDQGNWADHTTTAMKNELINGGVKVTPSSTGFKITHEKSFVVDEQTAYIMSINLTSPYTQTRDYAVVTQDPGVVKEFLSVFAADLVNAQNNTNNTPTLSDPNLVWSPVNSEDRLVAFVKSATKTLVVSSENLGDAPIQAALIDAATNRGVDVRVMAPLCDQNVNPEFDLPYLAQMNEGGVTARAMPGPPSASLPYTHAKMMIADGNKAFIGSVNFSKSSTTEAREVGIIFQDPTSIAMISKAFESDWSQAVAPPSVSDANCPAPAATAKAVVDTGDTSTDDGD